MRKSAGGKLAVSAWLLLVLVLQIEAGELRTGKVVGTVRLAGTPPVITAISSALDEEDCGTQPRLPAVLSLGSNQAVAQAIVYLSGNSLAPAGAAASPLVVTARDCELQPRIQVGLSGTALVVRNADPTLHVVQVDRLSHTNGSQRVALFAAPYAGFQKQLRIGEPTEPVLLRLSSANGRPWMIAYVAMLPHHAATLTDADGRFTLRDVPAGNYKLFVWHEVLGTLQRDVVVQPDRTTQVDCELTAARRP